MLTADQKAHFATFGFLTVRKAFSAGEMEEIIADAETVWGKDREGRASRERGQHITKFVEQGQALIRMVNDDRIAGAVEDLIGPDFLWAGSEGNWTVKSSHGWHNDRPSETDEELAFTRLKINIYLDSVTEESGALRVLPGSQQPYFHRALRPLEDTHHEMGSADPLATPYGVPGPDLPFLAFESEPGDLVFFNQSLFHAVFNGFDGRRYIALKFTAHPTTDIHFRLLNETGGFDFQAHSGFAGSELPRVRGMADRLAAAAGAGP